MNDDDLKFLIEFDANMKPVEDALAEMGKHASTAVPVPSKQYQDFADALANAHERATKELMSQRKLFAEMSINDSLPKLQEQVELEKKITDLRHNRKLSELKALADPSAAEARMQREIELLKARKEVSDSELEGQKEISRLKHKDALDAIKNAMDPKAIEEQVRQERELLAAQKEYQAARSAEEKRQDGPQEQIEGSGMWAKLLAGFSSGGMGGAFKALMGGFGERAQGEDGGQGETNALLSGLLGGQGSGSNLGQLGGMVGGAIGGPPGAMIGEVAAEMLPGILAAPVAAVQKGLSGVAHGLKELGGELGPMGAAIDFFQGGVESLTGVIKSIPIVGDLMGPMLDAATAIPGILKDITSTLTSFAAKASPAQFQMFTMAVEDAQAVIGQRFLPVLNDMREYARLVGDGFANFLPTYQEVMDATASLRGAFSEMRDSVRDLLVEIGPLTRAGLSTVFRGVSWALSQVVSLMTMFYQGLTALIRPLRELLGISQGTFMSSQGAAARPASILDFDAYQEQLQVSAYSQPGSSMDSVPSTVTGISTTLTMIQGILQALTPSAIGQAVADAIRSAPSNAASAAASAVQQGASTFGMYSPGLQILNKLLE